MTRQFTEYHPASHYWPLQLVETGILPALAVFAAVRAPRGVGPDRERPRPAPGAARRDGHVQ
ncbi:hypothetical protein [Streptomyces sp. NPDC096095]|uniref:hypothetical protein n=1 Tax=Streptomyces sp. NPDC096095 TaxID=3155545 RepID=UPI00332C777D